MLLRLGILSGLFFLFNASTCEREVELDIGQPKDRLSVYCSFESEQQMVLQLGKSRAVINRAPEEFLPNATVNLYEGTSFLEQLKFIPQPSDTSLPPHYVSTETTFKEGRSYRIEASLSGFDDIQAESSIPPHSTIRNMRSYDLVIDKDSKPGLSIYSYKINVKINDPQEAGNYYHLIVYQEIFKKEGQSDGTVTNKHFFQPLAFDISSNSNDIVSYLNQGILIKDNPFNNSGYNFEMEEITLNPITDHLGLTYFALRTVSEEYYLFHSSFARQYNADITGNLFSEPVFIFENVNNGYGIFAGYSTQWAAIDVLE